MAPIFSPSLLFLHFIIATQSIIYFASAALTSFTLPLIPPLSSQSPFYQVNLTQHQQLNHILSQPDYYLNSQSFKTLQNKFKLRVKNIPPSLFVTKLVLGTPATTQVLLLDTGSSTTWTQCKQCFNQTPVPLFNPNHSSSYHKVPCGPTCVPPYTCVSGVCKYEVDYTGGAFSHGTVSTETFTFNEGTKKLVFGCGEQVRNISFEGKGVSGIVGLNKFRYSLVNQLLDPHHRKFSYCLTTGLNKSSLLKFGEDSGIRGPGVGTLHLVPVHTDAQYHVNLIDISVGSVRMQFPPGTFEHHRNGSGGCIIDSGGPATSIDEGPYKRVMSEFHSYFTAHGLKRLRIKAALEYCYNHDPHFKSYIPMTFHFERSVDFVVDAANMYFMLPGNRGFCVVLKKAAGRTVIGAWQQVNKRIVYDLSHEKLHFKHDDCSRDDH